jgi:hypothetical protein
LKKRSERKRIWEEHMASHAWKLKRHEYREALPWICFVCKGHQRIQLHHITYERLGLERLEDLVPLCHVCHQAVHRLVASGTPLVSAHHLLVKDGIPPKVKWRKKRKASKGIKMPVAGVICDSCGATYDDGFTRLRCVCGSAVSFDPTNLRRSSTATERKLQKMAARDKKKRRQEIHKPFVRTA